MKKYKEGGLRQNIAQLNLLATKKCDAGSELGDSKMLLGDNLIDEKYGEGKLPEDLM